jgi:hypothetical protein
MQITFYTRHVAPNGHIATGGTTGQYHGLVHGARGKSIEHPKQARSGGGNVGREDLLRLVGKGGPDFAGPPFA